MPHWPVRVFFWMLLLITDHLHAVYERNRVIRGFQQREPGQRSSYKRVQRGLPVAVDPPIPVRSFALSVRLTEIFAGSQGLIEAGGQWRREVPPPEHSNCSAATVHAHPRLPHTRAQGRRSLRAWRAQESASQWPG